MGNAKHHNRRLHKQKQPLPSPRLHTPQPSRPTLPSRLQKLRKKTTVVKVSNTPNVPQLKVSSLNINGLSLRSANAVENIVQERDIDVFCLSEAHFRHDTPRPRFELGGYKAWHSDRSGRDKVAHSGILNIYSLSLSFREEVGCPFTTKTT